MDLLKHLLRYLGWYFHRRGIHTIHSPFVFEFYSRVIRKKEITDLKQLQPLRKELLNNKQQVEVLELGAGSRRMKTSQRQISDIAAISCSSYADCLLLANLVNFYQPDTIIELGTCLGIGTASLCMGSASASVTTIEGSPDLTDLASEHFKTLGISDRIHLIQGNIDTVLEENLPHDYKRTLVYIDANHQYDPVKSYAELFLNTPVEELCLVFDDIRWSSGMYRAWQEISKDSRFRFTIDLGSIGLAFKRPDAGHSRFILRR